MQLTPLAAWSTTTSPGPGSGSGRSAMDRTSGPPLLDTTIARTGVSLLAQRNPVACPALRVPRRHVTAERVKMRMEAAVMSAAQAARTSMLSAASVVVLEKPQISCSPAPVRSRTP